MSSDSKSIEIKSSKTVNSVDEAQKSGFLRKVFMEELGNNHKLVVTAIHAVLIDSGFVGFDPNTNLIVNRLCFTARMSSLYYTLPNIGTADTVVIKFQSLGKFISVYGSLSCGGEGKVVTRMVRLNEEQLVPFLNILWANCGLKESIEGQNGSFEGNTVEKEVFEFWRMVKDNLALPLLIDICEKAGLGLPPCFMQLPDDLKLKIMESLSAVEILKVGSTCSEMRNLASTDDLWKVKCAEEFGKDVKKGEGEWNWKKVFGLHWLLRHTSRRLEALEALEVPVNTFRRRRLQRMQQNVRLFRGRGRDYDMWPYFGGNFWGDTHFRLFDGGAHVNHLNLSPPVYLDGLD